MRCPRCGYSTFEFETCPRCESTFVGERHAQETAGFWIRSLAYALDNFLVFLGTVTLAFISGLATGLGGVTTAMGSEDVDRLATFFGFFIGIFSGLFYFTFFLGWCGQTPGKKLFGLKVIGTSGDPVTYPQALLRYFGYMASFLLLGLGFLMVAVDRKKRGLHDLIAGTQVIRTG